MRSEADGLLWKNLLESDILCRTYIPITVVALWMFFDNALIDAYKPTVHLFGILRNLPHFSQGCLQAWVDWGSSKDVELELQNEFVQFAYFFSHKVIGTISDCVGLQMLQRVSQPGIRELFPIVDTLLQIYLGEGLCTWKNYLIILIKET